MQKWRNEQNKNAMSGSELMMTELESRLGSDFLVDFQIILSRPRELDETKIRVLWCHDLPEDTESSGALADGGWKKFHRFVFVSHWQQQRYIERYGIPWSKTVVLKNAINPIDIKLDEKYKKQKDGRTIQFVYHTTPHRGLGILVPVFAKLAETHPDIHLNVFSSFEIYGWNERDTKFQPLYDRIKEHSAMTYNGFVSNKEMHEKLKEMDIYAYPSIWTETSCISLIEAMSAGLACVHPNLGALYETSSNWTFMYNFEENMQDHVAVFHNMLEYTLHTVKEKSEGFKQKQFNQKAFTDSYYNWENREQEWRGFLNSIRDLPREFEKQENFSYRVNL